MAATIDPENIRGALQAVLDPELNLSIVDLGLVYDIRVDEDDRVAVDITFTSMMCPVGPMIRAQVQSVVNAVAGPGNGKVNIVWDPPWDPRTMASEEVKAELGIW